MYTTPGLPFVPATAILVNIYLILNLSILTLVRFTIWMTLGKINLINLPSLVVMVLTFTPTDIKGNHV